MPLHTTVGLMILMRENGIQRAECRGHYHGNMSVSKGISLTNPGSVWVREQRGLTVFGQTVKTHTLCLHLIQ